MERRIDVTHIGPPLKEVRMVDIAVKKDIIYYNTDRYGDWDELRVCPD